jgi:hypothetical protein
MASINADLDAALVGCKERAAEFNDRPDWRPMSECGDHDVGPFLRRAADNLGHAQLSLSGAARQSPGWWTARRDLRDAVNLTLLALSIMERRTGGKA